MGGGTCTDTHIKANFSQNIFESAIITRTKIHVQNCVVKYFLGPSFSLEIISMMPKRFEEMSSRPENHYEAIFQDIKHRSRYPFEPCNEKTGFVPMRKQRCRSAVQ